MPAMQTLRNAHWIARFVLVWFALSLGAAIASPVVKPQALQWVCSGAGALKTIDTNSSDASSTGSSGVTLDCPLCAGLGSVPPFEPVVFSSAAPRGNALPVDRSHPYSSFSAAPQPARGPPSAI